MVCFAVIPLCLVSGGVSSAAPPKYVLWIPTACFGSFLKLSFFPLGLLTRLCRLITPASLCLDIGYLVSMNPRELICALSDFCPIW